MKKCLLFFSIALLLIACSKDDNTSESAPAKPVERTVLIYMSAENSLSSYVDSELEELKKGSVGLGNNALVIYVDMANSKNLPYIAHIKEGTIKKSYTFSDDPYSSDPQTLKKVLDYTAKHFPARNTESYYGVMPLDGFWKTRLPWKRTSSRLRRVLAPSASKPMELIPATTAIATMVNGSTCPRWLKCWANGTICVSS